MRGGEPRRGERAPGEGERRDDDRSWRGLKAKGRRRREPAWAVLVEKEKSSSDGPKEGGGPEAQAAPWWRRRQGRRTVVDHPRGEGPGIAPILMAFVCFRVV